MKVTVTLLTDFEWGFQREYNNIKSCELATIIEFVGDQIDRNQPYSLI